MADVMERLERLRGAPVQAEADPLAKFREDFKFMWRWWRHCGEISEIEMEQGMKEAGEEIRDNMHDKAWLAGAMEAYSQMAARARSDIARSERIRAEVRAEREVA